MVHGKDRKGGWVRIQCLQWIVLLFCNFLLSCSDIDKNIPTSDSNVNDSTSRSQNSRIASRFNLSPELTLSGVRNSKMNPFPRGFIFNHIEEFDSTLNMEIILDIPVSGNVNLDANVESDIRLQLLEFQNNTIRLTDKFGPHPFMPASFYCSTENIWEDSGMISYLMIVSFYNGIGVHGMATYHTCTFDKLTQRKITFNDYFLVQTSADTALLLNSILKAVNIDGLWLETIYPMDFHLRDSTIIFAYDDYEIASYAAGIIQAPIRKSTISSLIKPKYR